MILSHHWGYIILCLLAGVLYAGVLYYKNDRFSSLLRISLAVLRAVLVSVICFLLLSPSSQIVKEEIEPVKFIWLQDNSLSIINRDDSIAWQTSFREKLNTLKKDVEGELVEVVFDDGLNEIASPDFSGLRTDISGAIGQVRDIYANQNIGGIIISTDGNYNQGYDPRYAIQDFDVPIYSWVLGDTSRQIDVRIDKVKHNKVVYLNNLFPVEVNISSEGVSGKASLLTIVKNGKVLESKKVVFESSGANVIESFLLQAKEKGIHTYEARLSVVDGEKVLVNNVQRFYVEVLENKKKILIVRNRTHPDVGAVYKALQSVEEYEVQMVHPNDILDPLDDFNAVLIFQIPNSGVQYINNHLASYRGNVFYFLGGNTAYPRINSMQKSFKFIETRNMEEVEAVPNYAFTKFGIDKDDLRFFSEAPELWSNQSKLQWDIPYEPLYTSSLFKIKTEQALIAFGSEQGRNIGLINGEGLWRWRLYDYKLNNNHNKFDNLIRQSIRFLSSAKNNERFRVDIPSRILENEVVEIEAQLFNSSFELTSDGIVEAILTDENNLEYSYKFNTKGQLYDLDINGLKSGWYDYTIKAILGSETFSKKGKLFVEPLRIELVSQRSNYTLLSDIANLKGGEVFVDGEWQELSNVLNETSYKPLSHLSKKNKEWIHIKLLFFLILLLIGLEWVLRKRNGAY